MAGSSGSVGGAAGEGEEDVVEVGGVDRELADPMRRGPAGRAAPGAGDRAVAGHLQGEGLRRRARPRELPGGRCQRPGSVNCSRTWPPGMRRLSSPGVPSATIRPWSSRAIRSASWSASSRYWVVRKIVTPTAASSRMTATWCAGCAGPGRWSARPGRSAAASPTRVIARSSRRQHAARVGRGRACQRHRPGRTGPAARPPAAGLRRGRDDAGRPSAQVLLAGEQVSTAANWPVTPIAARTRVRLADHVVAGDRAARRRPGSGWTGSGPRGLAGAIGSEQGEDRAFGDGGGRCRPAPRSRHMRCN